MNRYFRVGEADGASVIREETYVVVVAGSREAVMANQPEEVFDFLRESKFPYPIK